MSDDLMRASMRLEVIDELQERMRAQGPLSEPEPPTLEEKIAAAHEAGDTALANRLTDKLNRQKLAKTMAGVTYNGRVAS